MIAKLTKPEEFGCFGQGSAERVGAEKGIDWKNILREKKISGFKSRDQSESHDLD